MDKLLKYERINNCETLQQLSQAIREIAIDFQGRKIIMGRNRDFDAERMAQRCMYVPQLPLTVLTREFGIRQQAIYILFSERKLSKNKPNNMDYIKIAEQLALYGIYITGAPNPQDLADLKTQYSVSTLNNGNIQITYK